MSGTRAFRPPPPDGLINYVMVATDPHGLCEHGLSAAPGWCLKCEAEKKRLNSDGQLVKPREGYEQ